MIGYRYKVTRDAVDVVQTTARGVVEFESTFGVSVGVMADGMPLMTHHYWMAWFCSPSDETFEQWLNDLQDFEVVTDGDSAGDGGS
jgi:hypothetical protein